MLGNLQLSQTVRLPQQIQKKQSYSPVQALFPDYTQNYICKISDAPHSLILQPKYFKYVPGVW